tara:strand:- start:16481 stop:16681 length:201 start_codon:yes stop_codon:yes gene_type:complete
MPDTRTQFLWWPFTLDEVLGWVVVLAIAMLYAVTFALTRPAKRLWWMTAAVTLALIAGLIWSSPRA